MVFYNLWIEWITSPNNSFRCLSWLPCFSIYIINILYILSFLFYFFSSQERRDGSSAVLYRVTAPGTYVCSLKFNDEHIPCSPFRIHVSDSTQTRRIASYILPSRTTDVHSARSTSSKEETLRVSLLNVLFIHIYIGLGRGNLKDYWILVFSTTDWPKLDSCHKLGSRG